MEFNGFMVSLLAIVIGAVVLYNVIKKAIKDALNEYADENKTEKVDLSKKFK